MRPLPIYSLLARLMVLAHGARIARHVKDMSISLPALHAPTEIDISPPLGILDERDSTGLVTINLINNMPSNNMHAYILTTDTVTGMTVLINEDGAVYIPSPNSTTVAQEVPPEAKCGILLGAQGSSTKLTLSARMINGRITLADGDLSLSALQLNSGYSVSLTDPHSNTHMGFLELNQAVDQYGKDTLWINPTYVDSVGLALPFNLKSTVEGESVNVQGIPADAVKRVCDLLREAEKGDDVPWTSLCTSDKNGNLIRVASPMVAQNSAAFSRYWEPYIDQVWSAIATRGISFNLQQANRANVNCTMKNEEMFCGDIGPFVKPCSDDIWKCSGGPFVAANDDYGFIGSRLCAAFHRGTLLIPGGEVQPSLPLERYYPDGQTYNKYAKIMHSVEVDGMGYTFPTDDTKPNIMDKDVSGLVGMHDVSELTIYIGGLNQAQQDAWASQATSATTLLVPTPSMSPSTTDRLPTVNPSSQVTSTITLPSLTSVNSVTAPSVTTVAPSTPPAGPISGVTAVSTGSPSTETIRTTITGDVQMINGSPMAIVTESIMVIVHQTTFVVPSVVAMEP